MTTADILLIQLFTSRWVNKLMLLMMMMMMMIIIIIIKVEEWVGQVTKLDEFAL